MNGKKKVNRKGKKTPISFYGAQGEKKLAM